MEVQPITFIIPTRNNLSYLRLCYNSIRALQAQHYIVILDDYSTDGTVQWLESLEDEKVLKYYSLSDERVGIVGMFDRGIEMSPTPVIFAFHADMVAGKNLDLHILKYLKPKTVVCATRVEPSLHPPGPEKITLDLGLEPEEFSFDTWLKTSEQITKPGVTTTGIFAPWCMYKEDFLGHDSLFAPQSREDSDLFLRFKLEGYNLIQSWEGLVYHFTSRGSRFNPYAGGGVGRNSSEWLKTSTNGTRNYIRKWGNLKLHDSLMNPIYTPKYNVEIYCEDCTIEQLHVLEIWATTLYCNNQKTIEEYIKREQPNTKINLKNKIKYYEVFPGTTEACIVLRVLTNASIFDHTPTLLLQLNELIDNDSFSENTSYVAEDVEIYFNRKIKQGEGYQKKVATLS